MIFIPSLFPPFFDDFIDDFLDSFDFTLLSFEDLLFMLLDSETLLIDFPENSFMLIIKPWVLLPLLFEEELLLLLSPYILWEDPSESELEFECELNFEASITIGGQAILWDVDFSDFFLVYNCLFDFTLSDFELDEISSSLILSRLLNDECLDSITFNISSDSSLKHESKILMITFSN